MRKTTEVTIDNAKYTIGHWHIDKQTDTLVKLIKLLGEPLVYMMVGAKKPQDAVQSFIDREIDVDGIGKAVAALTLRLGEADVKALLRDMVTDQVLCDGKQFDYNTHFMGRLGHLMKVAVAVVRHQYADFLDVLPVLSSDGAGRNSHPNA